MTAAMEILSAQLINGLSLGSIYVLLVTAFNLLLLVARIIHFSFPQTVVFSMYVAWLALRFFPGSFLAACIAAVGASVLINLLCAPIFQRVMASRRDVDINATMVVSLGIGMIITDLLSHGFNAGNPISFSGSVPRSFPLLRAGFVALTDTQLYAIGVSALAVGGFFSLLYRSAAGRSFRAIAEDPLGARISGIHVLRTGLSSYALAGLLGGITAVLMSLLLGFASPGLGEQVALKVLSVSIIAGLGNLGGGLVVGLLLGILEAVVQGYVPGSWSNAIAFAVLLAVILAKPKGLFGAKL